MIRQVLTIGDMGNVLAPEVDCAAEVAPKVTKVAKVACCATPAADYIAARKPGFRPQLGLVLGSGMGEVGKSVQDVTEIPYSEIPGFPVSTVAGHAGKLLLGTLEGVPVACLQGRVHLYEGISPSKVQVLIYTLRLLGCEVLFLTSAVGSLVEENGPGTIVALRDHINMQQGMHPLVGQNDPIGTRFPSMLGAYDPKLRALLGESARECGLKLPEGVFLAVSGPAFETPAEIQAYKRLGADVVAMSMVPDVICARHCGLRVVGCAICVNLAAGIGDKAEGHITHEDTIEWANRASADLKRLLGAFLRRREQWDEEVAKQMICLIDHTSFHTDDTNESIHALVDAAVAGRSHAAAVCVYPKFVPFVRHLQETQPDKYPRTLKVATVVNFPAGAETMEKVLADVRSVVAHGADDVAVVINHALLQLDMARGRVEVERLVGAVRAACPEGTVSLTVILESGELKTAKLIETACDAALAGGADYLQTSTAKSAKNASLDGAGVMLKKIVTYNATNTRGRQVGLKVAGGVNTLSQAKQYMNLVAEHLFGAVPGTLAEERAKIDASLFRFGSSCFLPMLREVA